MEIEFKAEEAFLQVDGYTPENAGGSQSSSYLYASNDSSSSRKRRMYSDEDYMYLTDDVNSPSEEMQSLLRQWGLEILTDRFSKNLIDVSVLDYIVDLDIVDLCKGLPMRYRLVLRHKLSQKSYKRDQCPSQTAPRTVERTKINSTNINPPQIVSVSAAPYQESMQFVRAMFDNTPLESSLNDSNQHPLIEISAPRRTYDGEQLGRFTVEEGIPITAKELDDINHKSSTDSVFVGLLATHLIGTEQLKQMSVTGQASHRFANLKKPDGSPLYPPTQKMDPKIFEFICNKVAERTALRIGPDDVKNIRKLSDERIIKRYLAQKIANMKKAFNSRRSLADNGSDASVDASTDDGSDANYDRNIEPTQ